MEQIQQHEWVKDSKYPLSDIQYYHCAHCPCQKRVERGDPWFFPDRYHFVHSEPACIARYLEHNYCDAEGHDYQTFDGPPYGPICTNCGETTGKEAGKL